MLSIGKPEAYRKGCDRAATMTRGTPKMNFTRAIVRKPSSNFAAGLTTSRLGPPDYELVLEQHAAYCSALERCGLKITRLEPDARYPDSTFIEDTALIFIPQDANEPSFVLALPGSPSRVGEVTSVGELLKDLLPNSKLIAEPGTLDGGDVCEAGNQIFIGVSKRTNEAGARQLAEIFSKSRFGVSIIDIRDQERLLHLKSGLAYLGDNRMVVCEAIANRDELKDFELVHVKPQEEYAANCIRVNDYVLIASGFPIFDEQLKRLGYNTIALDMSEFQKMDGGLSCLSLRF
jgi:dimethylargininase